jgi:hypothetical protein
MATWTFVKKSGAPAGQINISVGNDSFSINDTTSTTIVTSSLFAAGELASSPVLTLQGISSPFVPPDVVQDVSYVNGQLVTPGPGGTWSAITSGGGTQAIEQGNFGTNYALNFNSVPGQVVVVAGTLNANCTITVTNPAPGCRAKLLVAQDATGGRTLSVSDGTPAPMAIDTTASALTVVEVWCASASDVYASPVGSNSSGLQSEVIAHKDQPNGYAGLDSVGKLLASEMPASIGTQVVAQGNLGASYTLNTGSIPGQSVMLTGTLNANCTITVSGIAAGTSALFLLTQDATGGRTLSISNGVTSQPVAIPSAANAQTEVWLYSPDGTTLYIQGPNPNVAIITTTNATWPIPPGATHLEIICIGGYGGGAGGGSPSSAINQAGGSGGGLPVPSTQIVAVGSNTTLNVTIGAGGTAGAGGAAGGNPGGAGGNGGTTTVTGTGISVKSIGGFHGVPSLASSTANAQVGAWGAAATGGPTQSFASVGTGGISGGSGSPPIDRVGGGGGGGGPATATLGGGGGGAGAIDAAGAAGTSGASGTAAGVAGGTAVANGAGGGGGGGANGGAGGAGGAGAPGLVIVKVVVE